MRWPFRRKGDQPEPTTPAGADRTSDSAPATAPDVPARRSNRGWASLPPLPVTVARTAPLVTGPAPVVAPLPGSRTGRMVYGPPIVPRAGRADGLAQAVPVVREPQGLVDPPAPMVAPEPAPRRAVHARPVEQRAPLTEAAPEYVGEPRVAAEPHRAPGWLRYAPSWLTQGDGGPDPFGLPVSQPEPPRPAPVERQKPVLPTRLAEVTAEPEAQESGVDITLAHRPSRRANLGQSRRLGLGAPIKRAGEQELVLPPEQEPVPAQAPAQPHEPARSPAPAPVAEARQAEEEADEEPPLPQPPPQPPPLTHRPSPRPPSADGQDSTVPPDQVPVVRPVPRKTELVYKSSPAPMDRPARRAGTVPVPARLADAIRGRHGVDVSDVPVHRTPAAATEARSLGARAFTRDAEVYLPEDAGPIDSPKASGLLAHELVHVVQQRTLGPSLPALSTAAGAELEAAAVHAEHEHGHGGHAPAAELVHPSITQVIGQAARTAGVQLAPLMSEVSSVTAPTVTSATPPTPAPDLTTLPEPVRQDIDAISEASATRVLEEWTNPEAGGSGFGGAQLPVAPPSSAPSAEPAAAPFVLPTPVSEPNDPAEAEVAGQVLQVINLDRATRGQPAITTLDAAALDQIRGMVAEQIAANNNDRALLLATAATSSEPGITGPQGDGGAGERGAASTSDDMETEETSVRAPELVRADDRDPFPEDSSALRDGLIDLDKVDLDDLSTRLYDRLRSRLRMELLIDRERSGLLTDFR